MENKQTAVEWLVSQLNKQGFAQVVTDEEIQIAKEMEKEQIINAATWGALHETGEKHYDETYGNGKGNNKH